MRVKPTLWGFILFLWEDWGTRVSGGLSAPFTAFAVFADSKTGRIIWAVLAVAALFVMLYRAWSRLETRVLELEEKARVKLTLSYNKNRTGCIVSTPRYLRRGYLSDTRISTVSTAMASAHTYAQTAVPLLLLQEERTNIIDKGDYHRLMVETDSVESVKGCSAHLISLLHHGIDRLSGSEIQLTFAMAENSDTLNKTIHTGKPEFIDFLYITSADEVVIPAFQSVFPASLNPVELILVPGEYILTVAVISEQPTAKQRILLKWTGARKTSDIVTLDD